MSTDRIHVTIHLGDPDLKVPRVIRSRDLELFAKECKLTGWVVVKASRRWMYVHGEGEMATYRRKNTFWILESVAPYGPTGCIGVTGPVGVTGCTGPAAPCGDCEMRRE